MISANQIQGLFLVDFIAVIRLYFQRQKVSFIPNFQRKIPNQQKWLFYHGKCWLNIVCTACGISNIAQSHKHHTMVIIQLNSDKYEVFYDLTT